jgi:HAE1 family hydrophobic/amphiphilic exporter-1
MKKITQFSVNYPVTVSMIVLGIILLGYISFGRLGVELFPEMNSPRIFVEIKTGEKPPEEIEKLYIENIESQAIRQKGVIEVSSVCMVGSARVTVEYKWGSDMDEAFLDLQKSLTSYSQNSEIDEFIITQHNPNASPIIVIGMTHKDINDMDELRKISENYIRNELIRLEGIADVSLSGIEEKEVLIETNQYMLDAFGLTTDDLAQQIQSMNKNVSGGSIVEMGTKYIIKGSGLLKKLEDFENLVVTFKQDPAITANTDKNSNSLKGKVPVFLKDVAKVKFANKHPQNIVRLNGKRCVGLSIYKETEYNTVKAVKDLQESFEQIKKALPLYNFVIVQNQGEFIQTSISEVEETAIIGIIIAVFVLFIFLRRIKVTLIISFAIPISIIATFNLMYFNGLSLNIMTLGGLALGAGMLVDNAIVVMENIFRNREQGLSVREAAIKGTAEVSGAIIASTLTTIVVFLPIVYLHGASGALFKDQAWTVAFSLLASLFVAIFIIPMLYNWAYRKDNTKKIVKSISIGWYGRLLEKFLAYKYLIIGLTTLIIAFTVLIYPMVGNEYLPKSGTRKFSLEIELAEGTQLERTTEITKSFENILITAFPDDFDIIYSQIGTSKSTGTGKLSLKSENYAEITIRLKEKSVEYSEQIISRIDELLGNLPDAKTKINRDVSALQSALGTDESPLVVEFKGKELEVLEKLTAQTKALLSNIPELLSLKTSVEKGAPEIDLHINRYKASLYNLSIDQITNQLKDLLISKDAGSYEYGGEMSSITIKLPEISIFEFNNIKLKSGDKIIPLYEIASIEQSVSPKQTLRRNQNRIAKVTANIDRNIAFDKVIEQVKTAIKTIDLPPNYQVEIVGEEEKRQEALGSLSFALILSIILVYMVMASQFESLIHPFTILLTIPLAVVGSVWAFFILGNPLNIMALIGIIMLVGIAVNDSIILVDAINQFKATGKSLKDSIISAGENRIRPILMTSITTILALLPLTFGFGESASLRSPMAIAVISGLITSTLLTLVVIPCVYYVFDLGIDKVLGRKIVEANDKLI